MGLLKQGEYFRAIFFINIRNLFILFDLLELYYHHIFDFLWHLYLKFLEGLLKLKLSRLIFGFWMLVKLILYICSSKESNKWNHKSKYYHDSCHLIPVELCYIIGSVRKSRALNNGTPLMKLKILRIFMDLYSLWAKLSTILIIFIYCKKHRFNLKNR